METCYASKVKGQSFPNPTSKVLLRTPQDGVAKSETHTIAAGSPLTKPPSQTGAHLAANADLCVRPATPSTEAVTLPTPMAYSLPTPTQGPTAKIFSPSQWISTRELFYATAENTASEFKYR